MPENRYQAQKVGNDLISLVRSVFSKPRFASKFRVLNVNRIQDANGKDHTVKVTLQHPKNNKAVHDLHMSVLGYTPANKSRWPFMLEKEAIDAVKRIRMTSSRVGKQKELEDVDGGYIDP